MTEAKRKLTIWNRGDVVRLKSGGPPMTVSARPDLDAKTFQYSLCCVWFDGPMRLEAVFDSESLVSVRRCK